MKTLHHYYMRLEQQGGLCLAYPQVRDHFRQYFLEFLGRGDFAGLFVCLRSQSKPADFADQYGFNTPVREDFQARYGIEIRQEDFDLQAWRDLLGAYLTLFLTELRTELNFWGIHLAVGVPP